MQIAESTDVQSAPKPACWDFVAFPWGFPREGPVVEAGHVVYQLLCHMGSSRDLRPLLPCRLPPGLPGARVPLYG